MPDPETGLSEMTALDLRGTELGAPGGAPEVAQVAKQLAPEVEETA